MTFYKYAQYTLIILFATCMNALEAQNKISGSIRDSSNNEAMIGTTVLIKGTTTGTVSEPDGTFAFETAEKFPLTLIVSFSGYASKEFIVTETTKMPIDIRMQSSTQNIDVIVIKGQRVSEKQQESALTVESMDRLAIKQTAALSFYEGLGNLKGVDLTTAGLGFTIINTRGFNSTSPVRSLQVIDGVDNQAPGLNFSLGNFLGSSELDVLKVDLVAGASSAFYGPNAFNGVISIETKSPFYTKGLSASVKTGERNLLDIALRYADAFKNKAGQDVLGYKLNFSHFQAHDWEATNYDPVYGSQDGKNNPGRYDAVNRYGDEYSSVFDYTEISKAQPWNFMNLGSFHRTGYNESDLVDYNVQNNKANASFYYRLNPAVADKSTEVILSSSFGNGNTVYQGDNRFALKNILFFQNRIEIRQKDKFFLRAYATNEDAGNSYDPYFTALLLQEQSKQPDQWGPNYVTYWQRNIVPRARELGFPQLTTFYDPVTMRVTNNFDQNAANAFYNKFNDSLFKWQLDARNYADTSNTNTPFLMPGTAAFQKAFNQLITTKSGRRTLGSGTGFYDKSALYHVQGEYRFKPSFVDEWVVGGNYRLYTPKSAGTIFSDTGNVVITNSEFGLYTGVEKKFANDKIRFNGTLRMDKNQNFDLLFSPAASLVYQPDKINYVRFSINSAIRNPTLNDQYLNLNVGPAILKGNINGADSLITVTSFVSFLNGGRYTDLLHYFKVNPIKPEKVKSIELGYRTTLFGNTFVDMSYYFSYYTDFIGYRVGVTADIFAANFNLPRNIQVYRFASNAESGVTTQGYSIGINHYFSKYYQLAGNYSWNVLNTARTDSIIPAFNTPQNKFNLSLSARDLPINNSTSFGFNITYKWIQGFNYEGSPQFTGFVPTYNLVDAQVSLGIQKINSTLKLGASNLFDNQQFQVYGGPRIGRMAYVSILYEFNKK